MLVLGSPPYCTRIDYAVATKPELATLGVSESDFNSLRLRLSGSTRANPTAADAVPSDEVNALLRAVEEHPSHGSRTYYFPTFSAYFRDVWATVGSCAEALVPGGSAIFVVQDSRYKELRLPVQEAHIEAARSAQLELVLQQDQRIQSPRSQMNANGRKYRSDDAVTESVLVFRKSA